MSMGPAALLTNSLEKKTRRSKKDPVKSGVGATRPRSRRQADSMYYTRRILVDIRVMIARYFVCDSTLSEKDNTVGIWTFVVGRTTALSVLTEARRTALSGRLGLRRR